MEFLKFKIKRPKWNLRKILSSGPERYWTGFLLCILLLAVLTLVFDWRVFQKFSPAGLSPSTENLEMPILNRAALERTWVELEAREQSLKDYLEGPPLADPS